MEKEDDKFSVISEIYSHFTEENKEKLVLSARNLLKLQKEDAALLTDVPISQKESGKGLA